MERQPNDRPPNRFPVEQLTRTLERVLLIVLGIFAIAILVGAVLIIINMDSSSQSQGGRYYVAIGALVLLGFVDSQFGWLVKRHVRFSLTTTPEERRYHIVSLLVMFISAIVLIGLAWLLP